jgi:hypothetical protein
LREAALAENASCPLLRRLAKHQSVVIAQLAEERYQTRRSHRPPRELIPEKRAIDSVVCLLYIDEENLRVTGASGIGAQLRMEAPDGTPDRATSRETMLLGAARAGRTIQGEGNLPFEGLAKVRHQSNTTIITSIHTVAGTLVDRV